MEPRCRFPQRFQRERLHLRWFPVAVMGAHGRSRCFRSLLWRCSIYRSHRSWFARFRRRHKLPSTCETCNCEDHCLGCVCWGCALRQMEAQADHMKQQALSYAASRTSVNRGLRSVRYALATASSAAATLR